MKALIGFLSFIGMVGALSQMNIIEGAVSRGQAVRSRGLDLYVDTTVSASGDGRSWEGAFLTMAEAFAIATDDSQINVRGDIREEVLSPLGVTGCRIVGAAGGNTRHDDGVRWREPASDATTGGALLTLREQGWEVERILFVPKSDGTALRIRRAEDATYPDGSHAIIRRCKFIGAAIATTKGIEDHGGSHHNRIEDCEFHTLASGITHTVGAGIASPLRWVIQDCLFEDVTNHIVLPGNVCVVRRNVFDEATVNVNTQGGTAGGNFVLDNVFANNEADITESDGYFGHATDVWRNFTQNTAAATVGVPA